MRDRRPLLWSLSSSGGGHTITLDAILRRFVHHAVGEGDGEAPDLLERTYSMEPRGADVTAYLLALVAAELDSRAERLRRRGRNGAGIGLIPHPQPGRLFGRGASLWSGI